MQRMGNVENKKIQHKKNIAAASNWPRVSGDRNDLY